MKPANPAARRQLSMLLPMNLAVATDPGRRVEVIRALADVLLTAAQDSPTRDDEVTDEDDAAATQRA